MSGGARQLFDPEAPCRRPPPRRPPRQGSGPVPAAPSRTGRAPASSPSAGLYERSSGALTQAFPRNRHALGARRDRPPVGPPLGPPLYEPGRPRGGRLAGASRARGGVPTLNVKCWRSSWAPLRHGLAKEGIELAEGMVVVLRGALDLYRGQG